MKIEVRNKTEDFNSYRAARVKSLFNPERGNEFNMDAEIGIDGDDWQIGVIVGPSGSGKTSIGNQLFGGGKIIDLYAGWPKDAPIVEAIAPDGDCITGGTVFWLNSGIDRGDIAYQDWCFIDPALFAMDPVKAAGRIWRDELLPMGVHLMAKAIADISKGIIVREPQDKRFSTWEPSTEVKDIYRPDALMIEAKKI